MGSTPFVRLDQRGERIELAFLARAGLRIPKRLDVTKRFLVRDSARHRLASIPSPISLEGRRSLAEPTHEGAVKGRTLSVAEERCHFSNTSSLVQQARREVAPY